MGPRLVALLVLPIGLALAITAGAGALPGRKSVKKDDIAPNAVRSTHIAPSAVRRSDIALRSIDSLRVADGAIGTVDLGDGAVTSPKLADGSVGVPKLADGAVTGPKLADGSVGVPKLADGAVTGPKLADAAVGTSNLANAAVTKDKLGNGSVVADKFGRVVVRTATASVADNSNNSANATCNPGEVAVGGGGSLDAFVSDVALISSRPADSGAFFELPANGNEYDAWRTSAVNPSGGTGTVGVRAHVLCLQP